MGPADAKVTIVQFAEYQCPYCGKAGESVDKVMETYGDDVRMVFRDFPLSFHPRAVPAAVAANCAGEQGQYWEMHNRLMSNQRALEDADLTAHAEALKLDLAKWNTCREDPAQAAEVMKDFEDGQEVGVSGTPTFFINGIMISGAGRSKSSSASTLRSKARAESVAGSSAHERRQGRYALRGVV